MASSKSRELRVYVTGDTSSLERAFKRAGVQAQGFESNVKRVSRSAIGAFAGIGTAAGLSIGAAAKSTIDFDKAMRNVNSIAQVNEKQFGKLEKSVLGLAGKTAQAPQTLAEGLYDLVSSGFKANEALGVLHESAKAATAGLTDTATSTQAVAAVLNSYHLPAKEAAKVSDTLFQTVNRGVISFEQLSQTIGEILPTASSLGVGLDQVGASLSTLTKEGIQPPEAITKLRSAMVAFIKPSEGMAAAIKQTGAESGEALIKSKGFQGALESVLKTTDGTKQSVSKLFPDVRALQGAFALTGDNARSAHKDIKGFSDVTGATDKALKQQSKSISYQWEKVKAKISEVAIELGLKLAPMAVDALKKVGRFIGQMERGTGAGGKFADQIGEVADKFKAAGEWIKDHTKLIKIATAAWVAYKIQAKAAAAFSALPMIAPGAPGGRRGNGNQGGGGPAIVPPGFPGGGGANGRGGYSAPRGQYSTPGDWRDAHYGTSRGPAMVPESGGGWKSGLKGWGAGLGGAVAGTVVVAGGMRIIQQGLAGPGTNDTGQLNKYANALERVVKAGDKAGMQKLAQQLRDTATANKDLTDGKNLEQFADALDTTAKGGGKDLRALAAAFHNLPQSNGDIERVRDELSKLDSSHHVSSAEAKKVTDQIAGYWAAMSDDSDKHLRDIRNSVVAYGSTIRKRLGSDTEEGKDALAKNFKAAAKAVRDAMHDGQVSTKTGLQYIRKYMAKALEQYGFTPEQANNLVVHGVREVAAGAGSSQGGGGAARASGGWIGRKGMVSHDVVPVAPGVIAAYGEYKAVGPGGRGAILNRHQTPVVEAALRASGMGSLDQLPAGNSLPAIERALAPLGGLDRLFAAITRPHYLAGGGRIPAPQVTGGGALGKVVGGALNMTATAASKALDRIIGAGGLGKPGKGGLGSFDGLQVASWIVPILNWARKHGWTGHLTSGYRSHAYNVAQGRTYYSNHEGVAWPSGAIDVGGWGARAQGSALAAVLAAYPGSRRLIWGGPTIGDWGHFSATGHAQGGRFVATAYGPPWGGIQGTGVTANGTNLTSGPHIYGIAADPSVLPLGSQVKVWPNPFGYHGAFRVFDTGGAIKGNRIDFYDWRGRQAQLGWGSRPVTVTPVGGKSVASAIDKAKRKLSISVGSGRAHMPGRTKVSGAPSAISQVSFTPAAPAWDAGSIYGQLEQNINAGITAASFTPGIEDDIREQSALVDLYQRGYNYSRQTGDAAGQVDFGERLQNARSRLSELQNPQATDDPALRHLEAQLAVAQVNGDTAGQQDILGQIKGYWQGKLTAAQASGNDDAITEAATTLKSVADQLDSLGPDLKTIMQQQNDLLKQINDKLTEQADFSKSVAGITSREAVRALADMISGQIGGIGYAGRALTAGAGSVARY